MTITAFIVRVTEAMQCVRALRTKYDPSIALGVPEHLTILVPFMPPEQVSAAVLERAERAIGQASTFAFSLSKIGRFPSTTYLTPDPTEPFVQLTEALAREFPDFQPYGGQFSTVIPHLTVADGSVANADSAEQELAVALARHGPIHSTCAAVELLENSTGSWKPMHIIPLKHSDG